MPFSLTTGQPYSSFKVPFWEALLHCQAYRAFLWANRAFPLVLVTGLFRLDRAWPLITCLSPLLQRKFWEAETGPCPTLNPRTYYRAWHRAATQQTFPVNPRRNEWIGLNCGLERVRQFTTSSVVCKSPWFFLQLCQLWGDHDWIARVHYWAFSVSFL